MLCWFASRDTAEAALYGRRRLTEEDITMSAKSGACLDDHVCLNELQKYCEPQAWEAVQRVAELLKVEGVWYCAMCTVSLVDDDCVACESCLQWYHFKCVTLTKAPSAKVWFCKGCKTQY